MRLQKRTITYTEYFPDDYRDLLCLKYAAELLKLTLPGLSSAIDRGKFTEIVNIESPRSNQLRRFVLRPEIMAAVAAKEKKQNEDD